MVVLPTTEIIEPLKTPEKSFSSVFLYSINLFRFSLSQLQTVGLNMTMRASQLTSPWGMSGNGKFFKTWIKGPMTIRTKVFKLLSIVKHH